MTAEKITKLNQLEITENAFVQVRLAKQVILDGVVVSSEWHRTAFAPHRDIDAQIESVNTNLSQMNPAFPPIAVEDVNKIKAFAAVAWDGVEPHEDEPANDS